MQEDPPNDDIPLNDGDVKDLSEMCQHKLALETEIEKLENQLADRKDELRRVTEVGIPEKMLELGITEIKLENEKKVSVTQFYAAHISKARQDEAFHWLEENGHDSLIKRKITTTFGKGEGERADNVTSMLLKHDIAFSDARSVHPQTLKSFVREQIENGVDLPTDLFGVHIGNKATIK